MFSKLKTLSVGSKLSLIQGLTVFVALCGFTYITTTRLTTVYLKKGLEHLTITSRLLGDMVAVYDSSLHQTTDKLSKVLAASYTEPFTLDTVNTVKIGNLVTPTLKSGSRVLNMDFTRVDRFTATTGAVATLFAKSGDDFVRVATSLKKEDGSRAVGTLLGQTHPGYKNLLQGQEYVGKAHLFGRDYMTKYLPLKGRSGELTGILFIGLDFTEGLGALKDKIRNLKIGGSGYTYVLDAQEGKSFGSLVVHPSKEGNNLLSSKDESGLKFVKEMLKNKSGTLNYYWQDEEVGEKRAQEKVVAYVSYAGWNWLIACTVPKTELLHEARILRNTIGVASFFIVALIVVILQVASSRWIAAPLRETLALAVQLSEGDLTQRLNLKQKDEFGQVAGAMNRMVANTQDVIRQIAGSSLELASMAEQLSASTSEVAASNAKVSSQTQGAAAASEEMSTTVEDVAKNTGGVSEAAEQARDVAVNGARVVSEAVAAMHEITSMVERAAATVEALGNQSQKVGGVIEVIDDIADQTNLLALNAAIEAARAGEHGRGFAVVADEVRKLAEKTMKATREISQTITATQAESREAIEAMNQGQQMVRKGTELGEKAGEAIQSIQSRVVQASDQTQQIASATAQMATTLRDTAMNMDQIAKAVEQNSTSVDEIAKTVDALSDKAGELKALTAQFRV